MVERSTGVRFGARSINGRMRDHNEDCFGVDETLGLGIVCDGVGGHQQGEVASSLCVQTIVDLLADVDPPRDAPSACDVLASSIQHANDQVHAAGGNPKARLRMATTVVALWIVRGHAVIAHVGDSRCYLWRHDTLRRLTADHTFLEDARRHELGHAVDDEMAKRFAHVLTRSVGQAQDCMMDLASLPIQTGDRLLLCTDGLTGMLEDEVIAAILASSDTPDLAVARLCDAANERGGTDNITAVVVWAT